MSNTSPAAKQAGAILEIDLAALRANYKIIKKQTEPVECAAVLKADAYGLGVAQVAPVLAASGCRTFFVAHLCEGIGLRHVLGAAANIYVLNNGHNWLRSGCESCPPDCISTPVCLDWG